MVENPLIEGPIAAYAGGDFGPVEVKSFAVGTGEGLVQLAVQFIAFDDDGLDLAGLEPRREVADVDLLFALLPLAEEHKEHDRQHDKQDPAENTPAEAHAPVGRNRRAAILARRFLRFLICHELRPSAATGYRSFFVTRIISVLPPIFPRRGTDSLLLFYGA